MVYGRYSLSLLCYPIISALLPPLNINKPTPQPFRHLYHRLLPVRNHRLLHLPTVQKTITPSYRLHQV